MNRYVVVQDSTETVVNFFFADSPIDQGAGFTVIQSDTAALNDIYDPITGTFSTPPSIEVGNVLATQQETPITANGSDFLITQIGAILPQAVAAIEASGSETVVIQDMNGVWVEFTNADVLSLYLALVNAQQAGIYAFNTVSAAIAANTITTAAGVDSAFATALAAAPQSTALTSIEALIASVAGKVDKVTGKGLSDENYSAAEQSKLANLPTSTALAALLAALLPTATAAATYVPKTLKVNGKALSSDITIGMGDIIVAQAHIAAQATNSPDNSPTNLNLVTTLLGTLVGQVNSTNANQNTIADNLNALATAFNALLTELQALGILHA